MLGQVKTINNVKQIVPLTADTGSGNPIGTIIPLYKKSTPNGYLYCDGSTFDTTAYPGLYAYLGTNVLPDYREFALVGAEENTTDVYNASTNPTGTIHDHDVYSQGEAKDDQLQDHKHDIKTFLQTGAYNTIQRLLSNGADPIDLESESAKFARIGTVTRGKRKAVYFYIKATTGLDENQQDYVLNTLNNTLSQQRSYSTDEHLTGKKWIDGKPIYQKVIDVGTLPNTTSKGILHNVQNLGDVIDSKIIAKSGAGARLVCNYGGSSLSVYVDDVNIIIASSSDFSGYSGYAVIEYTKTTD